jgi:methionyl-tRNA formyltransferase
MRVVFLGTPEFAIPSLRALTHSSYQVSALFTQPDRPAGRGHKPLAPAVKEFGLKAGIPVYQPEKIRALENRPLLEALNPDFITVVAYGQILPSWLLQLPRMGCINVHGSLLPRYRGAAPVAWALLNGDPITGITTMLMDEHLDTGPMLLKRECGIPAEMTCGELAGSLAELGAELLLQSLDGLRSGVLTPVPQDDSLASLAPRITKEMAQIKWTRPAWSIHNMIRALNPWPLACSECRGQRLQILRSLPPAESGHAASHPGEFLGATNQGMYITCGEGTRLEILEVQPAGKKRISGRDFANGCRLRPGERVFAEGV